MDKPRLGPGSPVEIAARVLLDVEAGATEPTHFPAQYVGRGPAELSLIVRDLAGQVYVNDMEAGGLHRWSPDDGLWVPWPAAEIRNHVRLYDGAPYGTADTTHPVQITDGRLATIMNAIRDWGYKPGFFRDGSASYALGLATATLGASPLWAPPSPDLRCRNGVEDALTWDRNYAPNIAPPCDSSALEAAILRVIAPGGDMERGAHYMRQLEEWVGLSACGVATRWGRSIVLLGRQDGANGKNWLQSVIRAAFSPGVVTSRAGDLNMGADYQRGELAGKLLLTASELDSIKRFKPLGAVVTGDPTSMRFIGGDPFMGRPQCGVIWDCNALPPLQAGELGGVGRRYLPIPCYNSLRDSGYHPDDLARLAREQIGGWVWKCIRAADEVHRSGRMTSPDASQRLLIDEWLKEADPLGAWVQAHVVPDDSGEKVAVAVAHAHYRRFCEMFYTPEDGKTLVSFSRKAQALLPEGARRTRMTGGASGWRGVRIVGEVGGGSARILDWGRPSEGSGPKVKDE